MSALNRIQERLDDTTGWLEWISPRATTEIAVVYADGDVYLPTGGTAEEFAFANLRGRVHPLTRKDDLAALVAFARVVEAELAQPNPEMAVIAQALAALDPTTE